MVDHVDRFDDAVDEHFSGDPSGHGSGDGAGGHSDRAADRPEHQTDGATTDSADSDRRRMSGSFEHSRRSRGSETALFRR